VQTVNPRFAKNSLTQVGWDELGDKSTIHRWAKQVTTYFRLFEGTTAETLADAVEKLAQMGPRIRDPQSTLLNPQRRNARAADLPAMALGLALFRQGWTLCLGRNTRKRQLQNEPNLLQKK
jgi:hypothetical protein